MRLLHTLPALLTIAALAATAADPVQVSGIYPHLATFNQEGECGTGAVVPWADRLWVISYAPHKPLGSTDKLYEITPDLQQIVRPESIGGTPANRMIHAESQQLFIGPYVIDAKGGVRTITYSNMYGRHTGNARHLTDPANKIYYATMEEGFYEVDVKSLDVKRLFADEQVKATPKAELPGYHGKGFYSGQGRVVYANNGDHAAQARSKPDVPSGVLAEWDGRAEGWTVVRRNQFTEVTGPGGIRGNPHPDTDPIWSMGWDHRSLILMCLDGGTWHTYRLPKASRSYDGAHGWNTEWPRIRDIGPEGKPELMMTMHGLFWHFPLTFTAKNAAGIRPRSAYLKVVGDFCRWQDRLVLGCDDTAQSEFLNKRKAKGAIAGPGQSQSNLWFLDPAAPDSFGPTTAGGAVWLRDAVKADVWSDPFLFAGWPKRGAFFANGDEAATTFTLEVDAKGDGTWSALRTVEVPAKGSLWIALPADTKGEWIRVKSSRDLASASVVFNYGGADARGEKSDAMFDSLARTGDTSAQAGLIRTAAENKRTLHLLATDARGENAALYELDAQLNLAPLADPARIDWMQKNVAIPREVVTVEDSSILVVDEAKRRWRLPRGNPAFDDLIRDGLTRICREVCTERDLFNCHGTFYELPAENADGYAKIRPVASHDLRVMDYCSYRGLLVLTGVKPDAKGEHIRRSADGKAAVWLGAADDLWKLGKPRGQGGPWKDTAVKTGVASDAYLLHGYDNRRLELSHTGSEAVTVRLEVDATGEGVWIAWKDLAVPAGKTVKEAIPQDLQGRWIRFTADRDTTATAWLVYE